MTLAPTTRTRMMIRKMRPNSLRMMRCGPSIIWADHSPKRSDMAATWRAPADLTGAAGEELTGELTFGAAEPFVPLLGGRAAPVLGAVPSSGVAVAIASKRGSVYWQLGCFGYLKVPMGRKDLAVPFTSRQGCLSGGQAGDGDAEG